MSVKNKNVEMCSGPLFLNILKFAWPFMLTDFFQRLYNAADVVVIGRFAGQDALAGVGTTGSITTMILNLFLGLSIGVSVVLGQALGAKNDDKVHKTVHTAMFISIVAGVVVSIFGIVFAESLLKLIDVPSNVMPHAKIYMQIVFAGKLPALIYTFGAAILRAKGDTRRPLYIAMISGLINVILNLILVICFDRGADGVALATTVSQIFSAIWVIRIICRDEDNTKLYIHKIKCYKGQLVDILKVGIPSGLQSTIFAISNVIVQSSVNSFGSAAMAGSAASSNIGGFYYGMLHTFAQTCVAFVSQNMGAKNYKRIDKTVLYCCFYVGIIWLITALLTVFKGEALISIYAPNDANAIKMGVIRLNIVGGFYGLCGLMDVMSSALRGTGRSLISMIISVLGVCGIRIVWIFTVFKAVRTFNVLFYSFPISWIGTFLMHATVFLIVRRKLNQKEVNYNIL